MDLGPLGSAFDYPEILSDGRGGAVIHHADFLRFVDYNGNFTHELYLAATDVFLHPGDADDFYVTWHPGAYVGYMRAQRVSFDGYYLWPDYVQLSNIECNTGIECYGAYFSDGNLVAAFPSDDRQKIISQKADSSGNLLWGESGVFTARMDDNLNVFRATCSDQAGGLITVFYKSGYYLYAKRVRADGSLGGDVMHSIAGLTISVEGQDVRLS